MTSLRIRERVLAALDEYCTEPRAAITDGELFVDLGLDSIDAVELAMKMEEELDIEITDDEMDALKTVGDLVALVTAKVGQ